MKSMFSTIGAFRRRLYTTYTQFQKDDALELAAATAYYMALSFFPLMLILLAGTGLVMRSTGWGRDTREATLQLLSDQVAPSAASQVEAAIAAVETNAAVGGPIGLLSLLVASLAIFAQFDKAFDKVWNVPPKPAQGILETIRGILLERFRAFVMLLCLGLGVIAAFVLNMAISAFTKFASPWLAIPPVLWTVATLAVAVGLNWLLFTAVYKALPKARVRWSEAARGGLLASVIWEIGRRVLAALVIGANYTAYGVVGAFIAVLLWVYYALATLFFGAEYVQLICRGCDGNDEG